MRASDPAPLDCAIARGGAVAVDVRAGGFALLDFVFDRAGAIGAALSDGSGSDTKADDVTPLPSSDAFDSASARY